MWVRFWIGRVAPGLEERTGRHVDIPDGERISYLFVQTAAADDIEKLVVPALVSVFLEFEGLIG